MKSRFTAVLIGFCLVVTAPAQALNIQLISGDWQPINIVIERFTGEDALNGAVPSDIISNDLTASGNFHVLPDSSSRTVDDARLAKVRERGGEYVMTGRISGGNGGSYTLTFWLYDALTSDIVGNYNIPFNNDNKRLAAHNVANWIYEEIISKPGIFHTKIAYVLRRADGTNELKISDYDGYNRLTILSSLDNIISPTWSHDGNTLLYVSFEQNKPIIYRQSLLTGKRDIVANFKGSNSAPAVSPDGRTIAAALTEHGGVQQIYLLSSSRKSRLTTEGINTEPVFSPDGTRLVFTSDEGGTPQIYEYDLDKNKHRRLTFGSPYSVSADYSSAGDSLALIRRDENGDNIAVLDIASGVTSTLTDIRLADSPSFSPNDDIIAFIDEENKNYLATVSINGKVMLFWALQEEGNIIDPSWSPMKSDWF